MRGNADADWLEPICAAREPREKRTRYEEDCSRVGPRDWCDALAAVPRCASAGVPADATSGCGPPCARRGRAWRRSATSSTPGRTDCRPDGAAACSSRSSRRRSSRCARAGPSAAHSSPPSIRSTRRRPPANRRTVPEAASPGPATAAAPSRSQSLEQSTGSSTFFFFRFSRPLFPTAAPPHALKETRRLMAASHRDRLKRRDFGARLLAALGDACALRPPGPARRPAAFAVATIAAIITSCAIDSAPAATRTMPPTRPTCAGNALGLGDALLVRISNRRDDSRQNNKLSGGTWNETHFSSALIRGTGPRSRQYAAPRLAARFSYGTPGRLCI